MNGTPDVIQIERADDVCQGENRTPRGALVVGKIDRLGRLLDFGHGREADQLKAGHVLRAAELPRVHHVTDHLSLVRITLTGVNLNPPVLILSGAGPAEEGNVQSPPMRLVAAGNARVVI